MAKFESREKRVTYPVLRAYQSIFGKSTMDDNDLRRQVYRFVKFVIAPFQMPTFDKKLATTTRHPRCLTGARAALIIAHTLT